MSFTSNTTYGPITTVFPDENTTCGYEYDRNTMSTTVNHMAIDIRRVTTVLEIFLSMYSDDEIECDKSLKMLDDFLSDIKAEFSVSDEYEMMRNVARMQQQMIADQIQATRQSYLRAGTGSTISGTSVSSHTPEGVDNASSIWKKLFGG